MLHGQKAHLLPRAHTCSTRRSSPPRAPQAEWQQNQWDAQGPAGTRIKPQPQLPAQGWGSNDPPTAENELSAQLQFRMTAPLTNSEAISCSASPSRHQQNTTTCQAITWVFLLRSPIMQHSYFRNVILLFLGGLSSETDCIG